MNLDPYGLQAFARKETSQFGEDGITLELVRRLNPPKTAIEIGSGGLDRIENNTAVLLNHGWIALWVDPLLQGFDAKPAGVITLPIKATPEAMHHLSDPVGLLSIDVDGNDYWLWKAYGPGPCIVIIEFQAQKPLDESYIMPYDPDYEWDHKSQEQGASLFSMIELGKELGYEFVGTTTPDPWLNSPNAFFVRNDLVSKL